MFSFEIRGEITPELQRLFDERIVGHVRSLNADFRVALDEHPETATPVMRLFPLGEGPFASDELKIKQTRVIGFDSPER